MKSAKHVVNRVLICLVLLQLSAEAKINPYDVLELEPVASDEEIAEAYTRLH
jgi:hypothetical protein